MAKPYKGIHKRRCRRNGQGSSLFKLVTQKWVLLEPKGGKRREEESNSGRNEGSVPSSLLFLIFLTRDSKIIKKIKTEGSPLCFVNLAACCLPPLCLCYQVWWSDTTQDRAQKRGRRKKVEVTTKQLSPPLADIYAAPIFFSPCYFLCPFTLSSLFGLYLMDCLLSRLSPSIFFPLCLFTFICLSVNPAPPPLWSRFCFIPPSVFCFFLIWSSHLIHCRLVWHFFFSYHTAWFSCSLSPHPHSCPPCSSHIP